MSWHLDRQRQIILRQLQEHMHNVAVGPYSTTVTGRMPSRAPVMAQLPRSAGAVSELKEMIDQALPPELDGRQVSDATRRLSNKRDVMTAFEDMKRQADHFERLGRDKPSDHEYNVTARGLNRLYALQKVISREIYLL